MAFIVTKLNSVNIHFETNQKHIVAKDTFLKERKAAHKIWAHKILQLIKTFPKIKCDNNIKHVFFILTLSEPSVNRKDSRAVTLAEPPRKNLEPGPPS